MSHLQLKTNDYRLMAKDFPVISLIFRLTSNFNVSLRFEELHLLLQSPNNYHPNNKPSLLESVKTGITEKMDYF